MSVVLVERFQESGLTFEKWTINRPDKLNAISQEVTATLKSEAERLKAEVTKNPASVRGLILTGSGEKAFVAGADIAALQKMSPSDSQKFGRDTQLAFGALEEIPVPTVAAINGFALGGGLELAMCCDVLVAQPNARLGQPECFLGLLPGFGGMARFTWRMGVGRAFEYLCSGAQISANDALRFGLIDYLVPDGQTAVQLGTKILVQMTEKSAPIAVQKMKQVLLKERQKRFGSLLKDENDAFGEIFKTQDAKEGIAAFLEKRKAQFKGL
jgi:enoyl-CoA hydratase